VLRFYKCRYQPKGFLMQQASGEWSMKGVMTCPL
jgi:hypothetical protein